MKNNQRDKNQSRIEWSWVKLGTTGIMLWCCSSKYALSCRGVRYHWCGLMYIVQLTTVMAGTSREGGLFVTHLVVGWNIVIVIPFVFWLWRGVWYHRWRLRYTVQLAGVMAERATVLHIHHTGLHLRRHTPHFPHADYLMLVSKLRSCLHLLLCPCHCLTHSLPLLSVSWHRDGPPHLWLPYSLYH